MKRLLLMVVALFVATNVAVANPTSKMDMLSMSKADSSFLFHGKANVIALNTIEMKQTEGEWFWFSPWFYTASFAIGRWALTSGQYSPVTFDQVYSWYRNW